MRTKAHLFLIGLILLAWLPGDIAQAQRGGRGGGGGRGGAVGGGMRAGGAVGGGMRAGGPVVGPYGGAGAGVRSSGTVVGPAGGSRSYGSGSGSYTTGRGTTIDYGGAGRTVTGPGGTTAGRGVGGVQVTTPGGQTATKVGSAGGIQGPGGATAVGGRSIGTTTGPAGSGVAVSRGGAAVGPGGAVAGGSRAGAAVGPAGGAVAGASRGGIATGPGGTVAGGSRVGGAVGPGGNTVRGASHWNAASNPYGAYASASRGVAVGGAAGHYTSYRSATALHTQAGYVRTSFSSYNYFNSGWYVAHPRAWRAAAWAGAAYWACAPYATVSSFCGYPAEPVVYDYGSTLVYEDNRVFYNGEPVATAEEYTAQAISYAEAGVAAKPSEMEEWKSLGVFALIQGNEEDANNIFQLALNKDGVIRGNYHNGLTDSTLPVYGSVDKKTQRAAWIIGDKKDTVYETGVGNLMQDETTLLIHRGKERTQQWTLVRLEPPKEKKGE